MNMHSQKKAEQHDRSGSWRLWRGHVQLFTLSVMLLGSVVGSSNASASEYKQAATQNYLVEPKPEVSLETATAIIRHRTGGRVLSANSASRGSEVGYQVRVLVDERQVQTWFVDREGRAQNE